MTFWTRILSFRLLRAKVRYWKWRALKAERQCIEITEVAEAKYAALQSDMDAEVWRNRYREDTFASAAVLGSRNMFGLEARSGPAAARAASRQVAPQHPLMTGADRMEFETFWLPDAIRNNVTPQQAEKDFLREITQRKALRDEPSM